MHPLDRRLRDLLARDALHFRHQRARIPIDRPALPQAQRAIHEHRIDLAAVRQAHHLPREVPARKHLGHVGVQQQEIGRQPLFDGAGDARKAGSLRTEMRAVIEPHPATAA